MTIFLETRHNICRLGTFTECVFVETKVILYSSIGENSYIDFKDEKIAKKIYKKVKSYFDSNECECFIQL